MQGRLRRLSRLLPPMGLPPPLGWAVDVLKLLLPKLLLPLSQELELLNLKLSEPMHVLRMLVLRMLVLRILMQGMLRACSRQGCTALT